MTTTFILVRLNIWCPMKEIFGNQVILTVKRQKPLPLKNMSLQFVPYKTWKTLQAPVHTGCSFYCSRPEINSGLKWEKYLYQKTLQQCESLFRSHWVASAEDARRVSLSEVGEPSIYRAGEAALQSCTNTVLSKERLPFSLWLWLFLAVWFEAATLISFT
jgi:hypothetical protein